MLTVPYRGNLRQIVVMNPKGGCGKTTLATNLASYLALSGSAPLLIDNDPSGYTTRWLERRPPERPRVYGIRDCGLALRGNHAHPARIPKESAAAIIDTPAALKRDEIVDLTRHAACILVPILPSAFDTVATARFIAELLVVTEFDRPIGVVANRTRANTHSLAALLRILGDFETPTVAVLRNSQNYVRAADLGLSIFELQPHMVRKDIEQMQDLLSWVDRYLQPARRPGLLSRLLLRSRPVAADPPGLRHTA